MTSFGLVQRLGRIGLCTVALGAVGLSIGCEKKSSTAAPEARGLPPLAGNAAAPNDRPVHAPSPGNDPHGMGSGDPHAQGMPGDPHGGLPSGHPQINPSETTPGNIQFDPKTVIAGKLELDPKLKDAAKEGDVIFMVARGAGEAGAPGPIIAVKRFTVGKWPLEYTLDSRDAMMAGTKMSGKVVVSARIDKDGDAITKNPGDVTGQSKPVEAPASAVNIKLDTKL